MKETNSRKNLTDTKKHQKQRCPYLDQLTIRGADEGDGVIASDGYGDGRHVGVVGEHQGRLGRYGFRTSNRLVDFGLPAIVVGDAGLLEIQIELP